MSTTISCNELINFPSTFSSNTVHDYILPAAPARNIISLYYNMYSVPDQIDVIVDGSIVASTLTLVYGNGILDLNSIPNDKVITIRVTLTDADSVGSFRVVCESAPKKICCPVHVV